MWLIEVESHGESFRSVTANGKQSMHVSSGNTVVGLGNPMTFLFSSGSNHDSRHAVPLLSQTKTKESNIISDKAYGSQAFRECLTSQEAGYTIPPKRNNPEPWYRDYHVYKVRYLVGCSFQTENQMVHRILSRYDKLDASFFAFILVVVIVILVK